MLHPLVRRTNVYHHTVMHLNNECLNNFPPNTSLPPCIYASFVVVAFALFLHFHLAVVVQVTRVNAIPFASLVRCLRSWVYYSTVFQRLFFSPSSSESSPEQVSRFVRRRVYNLARQRCTHEDPKVCMGSFG